MRPDPIPCRVALAFAEYRDGAFRGRARNIDVNLHALAIVLGLEVDPAGGSRTVTNIGDGTTGAPFVCFWDLGILSVRRALGENPVRRFLCGAH